MVYTTQPFKIIVNPSQQPISVGGEENPPSGLGAGFLPDWLVALIGGGQYAPPINIGVPSTGSPDLINEPPGTTSCPAGYALNNQNQCVLIPIGTGLGDITQVQVPTTTAKGGQAIIKTWFKNNHTTTLEYQAQIIITGLSINVTSPALSVAAGQTAMIESTINVPTSIPDAVYAGVVQLRASSVTTTGFVLQDSESFGLGVGTASGGGGTGTISPSASSVLPGQSISITVSGFAAGEVVDFVAKVGTTSVAIDAKTMGSNGSATLSTLTFNTNAPAGTATITATGRTSGKIGTATVTVGVPTTGGTAILSTNKASYVQGETISVTGSGYVAGEKVHLFLSKDGIVRNDAGDLTASSSGTISGSITANYVTSSGLNVRAEGRTSKRMGVRGITVTAAVTGSISMTFSKTSVARGSSFAITATGASAGERVTFIAYVGFNGVGIDTGTADSTGKVTLASLLIRPDAPKGTATVKATGQTSGRVGSKTITVT